MLIQYPEALAEAISELTGHDAAELQSWIEIPPQPELGDFAFPCFRLAKTLRQAPPAIAAALALQLADRFDWLQRAEAVGGYLNFFVDRAHLVQNTLSTALQAGRDFGRTAVGAGKTVLVEYSSPNIAKPFHVGHGFSTFLGQAISNLFEFQGYEVVRLNHLGDYGTQFGKLIVAWQLWGSEAQLAADAISELTRVYVKFHQEVKTQPSLEDDAREAFRLLETGDAEAVRLWQQFREASLQTFQKIYDRCGIEFDNYNGESFYSDQIPAVVDELRQKGLLLESEGAQVVDLEAYGLNPCLILKSDGTTIYASRDLAAVLYRDRTWAFDRNIYVVGLPQSNHFRQVFAVLDKAGFEKAGQCVHVGFGTVRFADGIFSTRSGQVILLEDLLNETVAKTRAIIVENNPDLPEQAVAEIAEKVGLGAVTYMYLRNGRERDILFSWREMLDFDGDTAVYLLYTVTRCKSVLRKAGETPADPETDFSLLTTDDEFTLAKMIRAFPEQIKQAAEAYEPSVLARHLMNISRAFNRFYHHQSVLHTKEPALRQARLMLVQAVEQTLVTGLHLLSIQEVERM